MSTLPIGVSSEMAVTLLRCSQIIAAAYAAFCLMMMCRSLMPGKHQNNLDDSDKDKRNGQADQPACKTLQLCRRLRLLIGYECHNLRQVAILHGNKVRAFPPLHAGDDVGDLGVHKSKHGTMPNHAQSDTTTCCGAKGNYQQTTQA